MLCIPLRPYDAGHIAKVDNKDFWRLADYEWWYLPTGTGYAFRTVDRQMVLMHREILGLSESERADHIDGDGLNNQRKNLRAASASQNSQNKRRRKQGYSSKYKGVFGRPGRAWVASIRVDGKSVRLGGFATEEEAAQAYDTAAREHFGEFACVNFPKEGEQSAVA